MAVADYALAALCVVLCLVWGGLSLLVSQIDSLVPAPNAKSSKAGAAGCVSLLSAMVALGYFVGVLWHGDWGWL